MISQYVPMIFPLKPPFGAGKSPLRVAGLCVSWQSGMPPATTHRYKGTLSLEGQGKSSLFHWCLGQWLGVGWCSNLLFEKLLHCYSPVESLRRAWSVHMGISRAHAFVFVCISSGFAVDKTLLNLQHDSTLQLTGLGIWCRTAGSQRSFCYVANLRRVVVKSLVLNCCVLWHLVAFKILNVSGCNQWTEVHIQTYPKCLWPFLWVSLKWSD